MYKKIGAVTLSILISVTMLAGCSNEGVGSPTEATPTPVSTLEPSSLKAFPEGVFNVDFSNVANYQWTVYYSEGDTVNTASGALSDLSEADQATLLAWFNKEFASWGEIKETTDEGKTTYGVANDKGSVQLTFEKATATLTIAEIKG